MAECPEGKLTEELCARYPGRLFVWMLVMEEFQNYFELPDQKLNAQIADLLSFIMAVGPSSGVLIESLSQKPSGVGAGDVQRLFNRYRDNHTVRFALKCGNRVVSDAILGGDAYSEGFDAAALPIGREYLGVGYLYGAADHTPTVRTYLADAEDTEKIVTAARVLRERAGTLDRVRRGGRHRHARPGRARRPAGRARQRGRAALAGARRPAGRPVPRPVGRRDRRGGVGAVPGSRRAERGREGLRCRPQGMPPGRGTEGGQRMTRPLPGSAAATVPDLPQHPKPLPAATRPPLLTCAVAGSGTRPARQMRRCHGRENPGGPLRPVRQAPRPDAHLRHLGHQHAQAGPDPAGSQAPPSPAAPAASPAAWPTPAPCAPTTGSARRQRHGGRPPTASAPRGQKAAAKRKAAEQARRQKAAAAAAAKRRAAADRKRKAAADRAERRKAATALRKGNTVPSLAAPDRAARLPRLHRRALLSGSPA